jgi:hypothetical protein
MHKQVFEANCRLLLALQFIQVAEVPAEHVRHDKWHSKHTGFVPSL